MRDCKHCNGTGKVEERFIIETSNGSRWSGCDGRGVLYDTLQHIFNVNRHLLEGAKTITITQVGG